MIAKFTQQPCEIDHGWLKNVRRIPSPHFDERPNPNDISLLVIHYISLPPDEFGGHFIDDFFQGKLPRHAHPYFAEIADMRVSAHCLIDRQGCITQYVNFHDRAWHAGVSCFQGREKCNDYAIGIELEGSNNHPFTPAQYNTLSHLTALLQRTYPNITHDRIVGHCHIAPERKIDPGQFFHWQYFQQLLLKNQT
ncbi:1,6-anhydro-N-acetylmuramyl-L-alanine amidase AmpD [Pasteurellaceae bacterium HPA106]|uniref:1,6-anhydro-N-acetylmuramyl-L-alanine amidase AmpD n=1 Tax=Spirabiliibacterium pneumoniae TaxID=221400 RepID=UPI001AAC7CC3|nr:1,6-anhydro-N-acetylmuramyl-L-alanine amidase AmpD [Spirabiliibacterium pneumoniae]MBE2896770.1 1,6-anhydro-N-acetylmuramyl-L-alanine amidase AmpD [Spirabiliibacterium pneumoniae]